ncbi:hypothetical protein AeRB84_013039 [Aphanomyces euteiches]|nr:hypothetical protein AeRB84_013039 [Aphanomyces euteiches]
MMGDKEELVRGREASDDDAVTTSYQTEELRGYLLKKTRNGKWQKRWFETNGCFLTYYKKQGQKLLAALNLPQVGEIVTLPEDTEDGPGLFSIELNERIYTIKAKNQDEAKLWVEALVWRQQGGLVTQGMHPPSQFSRSFHDIDDLSHLDVPMNDEDALDTPIPTVLPPSTTTLDTTNEAAPRTGCAPCCVIQ